MFCSKCGSEIEEGELFCGNCGTKADDADSTPASEKAVETEPMITEAKKDAQPDASDASQKKEKKLSGSKHWKTPIVVIVVLIWLLMMAGLIFFLYSIVMKAATIRLSDYEGNVTLTSESGRVQELKQNLRIFGGSKLETGKRGKAWVLLDEDRMVTVMHQSTVDFYQNGKSISLSLEKGDLFFNIARDLEEDESFDISVSTMIIGVRGTSGYVREDEDGYPVLYLTSGKVMVYVEDPESGNTDQRKVKAGQKLTVILTDDGIEMIVEDINLNTLPEEAVFEIVTNDDLFDEVLEETGWDKEELEYLYDAYKYGIKVGDENGEAETAVAEGVAKEIVGTWIIDHDLSTELNVVDKYLYFYNDMTGKAAFFYEDAVEEYEFKWSYVESTGMVMIDCDNNIHDAAIHYDGLRLTWLNNVFAHEGTDVATPPAERTYDIVGSWKVKEGQDTDIYSVQFNNDNTGVIKTYVGGAYYDIKVAWDWTDGKDVYFVRVSPGQYITGLEQTEIFVIFSYDVIYLDDIEFVNASVSDVPSEADIEIPDSFPEWSYSDYGYYSAWNGDYKDPGTGMTITLYVGAPATGGVGSGRMVVSGTNSNIVYCGDDMFLSQYEDGTLFWLTEENIIKVRFPSDSQIYWFFKV